MCAGIYGTEALNTRLGTIQNEYMNDQDIPWAVSTTSIRAYPSFSSRIRRPSTVPRKCATNAVAELQKHMSKTINSR